MKWSKVKDEPVKDILGNVNKTLIERLLERKYKGDVSNVPVVDYLAPVPKSTPSLVGVTRTVSGNQVTYEVSDQLPDTNVWLETLAGPNLSWLRALLTSKTIVRGSSYLDNALQRLLAPRRGQKVVVAYSDSVPTTVTFYGGARSYGPHIEIFKAVEIVYTASSKAIEVTVFEERGGVSVPLSLHFIYKPSQGFNPIHEVAADRNKHIKEFYWKLWYGDNETLPNININDTFAGPEVTISEEDVEQFCAVVGNQGEAYTSARTKDTQAPMDFAIVTGWKVGL